MGHLVELLPRAWAIMFAFFALSAVLAAILTRSIWAFMAPMLVSAGVTAMSPHGLAYTIALLLVPLMTCFVVVGSRDPRVKPVTVLAGSHAALFNAGVFCFGESLLAVALFAAGAAVAIWAAPRLPWGVVRWYSGVPTVVISVLLVSSNVTWS